MGYNMPPVNHGVKRLFLIDTRVATLKVNEYKSAKIESLLWPKQFGMDETYFGGNIYCVAKLKSKNYYLLVSNHYNTLGICLRLDELEKCSKNELLEWSLLHRVNVSDKDTKQEIINKLTELA